MARAGPLGIGTGFTWARGRAPGGKGCRNPGAGSQPGVTPTPLGLYCILQKLPKWIESEFEDIPTPETVIHDLPKHNLAHRSGDIPSQHWCPPPGCIRSEVQSRIYTMVHHFMHGAPLHAWCTTGINEADTKRSPASRKCRWTTDIISIRRNASRISSC